MSEESRFGGITIRGWIASVIVLTVCLMSLCRIEVKEPLYTLVISAVSFYLGSRNNMKMPQNGSGSGGQS